MQHSFDIDIAKQYGINIAIFLNNIMFWIQKNMANQRHFHEGRYWTYNSVKAYSILFPYFTSKQVRTTIQSCLDHGLLLKGNFNQSPYDRTSWYTFTDYGHDLLRFSKPTIEEGHLPQRANEIDPEGGPIPDINTDTKNKRLCPSGEGRPSVSVDNSLSGALGMFDMFWEIYPRKEKKKLAKIVWTKNKLYKISDKIMSSVKDRIAIDPNWQGKDDNKFVPLPTSYLNGERWEDELPVKPVVKRPLDHQPPKRQETPFAPVTGQSTSWVSHEEALARDREYHREHYKEDHSVPKGIDDYAKRMYEQRRNGKGDNVRGVHLQKDQTTEAGR